MIQEIRERCRNSLASNYMRRRQVNQEILMEI